MLQYDWDLFEVSQGPWHEFRFDSKETCQIIIVIDIMKWTLVVYTLHVLADSWSVSTTLSHNDLLLKRNKNFEVKHFNMYANNLPRDHKKYTLCY